MTTDQLPDLLPCPFCGADAEYRGEWWKATRPDYECRYRVQCEYCEARTAFYDTIPEAAKAWNERVTR